MASLTSLGEITAEPGTRICNAVLCSNQDRVLKSKGRGKTESQNLKEGKCEAKGIKRWWETKKTSTKETKRDARLEDRDRKGVRKQEKAKAIQCSKNTARQKIV